MMLDYVRKITYHEGYKAYNDGVLCMDNPYEGVNNNLYHLWDDGWWDAFYEEIE